MGVDGERERQEGEKGGGTVGKEEEKKGKTKG